MAPAPPSNPPVRPPSNAAGCATGSAAAAAALHPSSPPRGGRLSAPRRPGRSRARPSHVPGGRGEDRKALVSLLFPPVRAKASGRPRRAGQAHLTGRAGPGARPSARLRAGLFAMPPFGAPAARRRGRTTMEPTDTGQPKSPRPPRRSPGRPATSARRRPPGAMRDSTPPGVTQVTSERCWREGTPVSLFTHVYPAQKLLRAVDRVSCPPLCARQTGSVRVRHQPPSASDQSLARGASMPNRRGIRRSHATRRQNRPDAHESQLGLQRRRMWGQGRGCLR